MKTPLEWLRRKRVWIPLLMYGVYALVGFFILPGILRTQIVEGIRKNMKREARLDRVYFNPLILSLKLEGFDLKDPDGTSFVAFDGMYADLQVSSLVRWAITFRKFRLDSPRVHVRLMKNGEPNFLDMIPKEEGKPPRLVIGRFEINHGSVELTNLMAHEPEDGTITPIDLTLDNFTTIPRREGEYRIVATDPGNGRWEWTGDLTFEPMHSAGVLEISESRLRSFWEIAKHRVGFEIADGRFGCRFQYAFDVHGDSVVARIHDTSLSVAGLVLREKGKSPDLLKLDSLVVSGIEVRYPEQTAEIARVLLAGTRVQAWRSADSTLNWLSMLAPPPGTAPQGLVAGTVGVKVAPDSTASTGELRPWDFKLLEFAVRNLAIDLEDRTVDPPFVLGLAPVNATVRNITSHPERKVEVATDVTVAGKGRIEVEGSVVAEPLAADLDVEAVDLPLPILQPYITPVAKLHLVSGTIGLSGKAQVREVKSQPQVSFQGGLSSHNFLTRDRLANDRFLAWKSVAVNAVDYTPQRLRIGSVRVNEPYSKILIFKDRTTNVQDILGIGPDSAAVAKAAEEAAKAKKGKKKKGAAPTPAKVAADTTAPVFPVRVGKFEVVNASADFADLSLILPFAARIEHLNGGVTGLSSDSLTRADVALDGTLQPSGTAQVRGQINPLAEKTYMDLAVIFRGFNMPVLTPYTGQFIGREVDKGMMSLDLGYKLNGRHLVGENKVELDQFELGEKVESPEATHLPVGLAVAIMKDGDGKIHLDMPVEGDIDDPKFRIGRIIWDFIMSLLKKVATAPFALLGAMFGGGSGDELSHIDFEPGSSVILQEQDAALTKLAEALGKRPQLNLEVRGKSDEENDAAALKHVKFATLASEKLATNPKLYGGGVGYSQKLLEDLYADRFGKPGVTALKERYTVPAGELKADDPLYKAGSTKRLLDQPRYQTAIQDTLTALQTADPAELLSLANARGNAIKLRLVEQGIDAARVFVLDPEPGKMENSRIRVDLNLTD